MFSTTCTPLTVLKPHGILYIQADKWWLEMVVEQNGWLSVQISLNLKLEPDAANVHRTNSVVASKVCAFLYQAKCFVKYNASCHRTNTGSSRESAKPLQVPWGSSQKMWKEDGIPWGFNTVNGVHVVLNILAFGEQQPQVQCTVM